MNNHKLFIVFIFLICLFSAISYGLNFHGCAYAPNSNHGWVVTIESTLVYHTWNGGDSWERVHIPTSRDFFDIFFLDSLRGWTGNRYAMIWHTTNGGDTWHWQTIGGAKFATRILFIDTMFGWASCGNPIVLHTNDGGTSWWQVILDWLPMDTVDFYGVSFVDEMNGWMAAGRYLEIDSLGTHFKKGQGYIVHSEDGGDSWVLQRRDTIYDFFDVKFKDEQEGWVVGGNDSTMEACVLYTTNGGGDWNQLTIPSQAKYLRALELVDGNKLWAVGRNGSIIYSSNGGNSWQVQTSNIDTTLFDVDFADSLRGLIAGNGVVLYTRNGGNTWIHANITGITERENPNLPSRVLINASPNPFSKNTTIRCSKSRTTALEFQIFNTAGELVASLKPSSNFDRFIWDGKDYQGKKVGTGIYFGYLKDNNQISNQKLRLVKIK